MHTHRSLFGLACRAAALSFLVAGTVSLTQAQSTPSAAPSFQTPLFMASAAATNPFTSTISSSSSSSSSDSNVDPAIAATHFDLNSAGLDSSQPPPRRRYGNPNYSDSHSNPDGSPKWTFLVGGGFTLPVGGTHYYATPAWKIQVGGGRNFNKTVGVMLQFDYDRFGMQTAALNKQLALYNTICGEGGCGFNGLNGNVHDWSFSLNPTFTIPTEGSLGAYAVVGVGFYHKYTQFTTPTTGLCIDPYFGFEYQCTGDSPVDWYTSNAAGVNGGFGVTWKFSKFSNEKFYAEARYVYTANSRKPYNVSGTTNYFNAFPPASAPTTYIPVTFGLRF